MARRPVVLIVDDEKNILTSTSRMLDLEGFEPVVAGGGRIALEKVETHPIEAVLLDVRMPDMDGLQVLDALRKSHPDLPVIVMSGHATVDIAIRAIQSGAHDFIEKPLGTDRLLVTLGNALKFTHLQTEHADLKRRVQKGRVLVGESVSMRRLRDDIEVAAPTRATVLVTGENGTGKELVARAVHDGSTRARRPFIKVNCAAIPKELIESELFGHERGAFTGAEKTRKGKFELADGGTILLDEIGDMRLDVQAKLLRVLQEREVDRVGGARPIPVDVRVIAATNKDLGAEIQDGRFREDLFFRINVIPIRVPPLRERRDDIPLLVRHFVQLVCEENDRRPMVIDADAMAMLGRHDWPGNVRELRNICERLVILTRSDRVTTREVQRLLPEFTPRSTSGYERDKPLREMVASAERTLILAALEDHDGHITNAAVSLGLARSHLYKKMKALGIR